MVGERTQPAVGARSGSRDSVGADVSSTQACRAGARWAGGRAGWAAGEPVQRGDRCWRGVRAGIGGRWRFFFSGGVEEQHWRCRAGHATPTAALGGQAGGPPRCFKATRTPASQQHRAASNAACFDPVPSTSPLAAGSRSSAGRAAAGRLRQRGQTRHPKPAAVPYRRCCTTAAAGQLRCLPEAPPRRAASRADRTAVAPPCSLRAGNDGTIVRRSSPTSNPHVSRPSCPPPPQLRRDGETRYGRAEISINIPPISRPSPLAPPPPGLPRSSRRPFSLGPPLAAVSAAGPAAILCSAGGLPPTHARSPPASRGEAIARPPAKSCRRSSFAPDMGWPARRAIRGVSPWRCGCEGCRDQHRRLLKGPTPRAPRAARRRVSWLAVRF